MPEQNPYLSLVQNDQADTVRQSMLQVADLKPDTEARLQGLAKRYNLPVDAVRLDPTPVERQAKLDAIDYGTLAKRLPATANFLGDPQQAAISHDNVENMGAIESLLRPVTRAVRSAVAGLTFDLFGVGYGLLETGVKLGADAIDPLAGAILPENPLRRPAAFLEWARKDQQRMANKVAGDQTGAGFFEGAVNSGFRSFGQMLPGMAASLATGNPMFALGSAGAVQGSQSTTKALDAGKSTLQAIGYGAADATAEIATEMIPVARLLKDVKAGSGFFKTLGAQIATEVPTELAATAWQNFNEWAALHPEKPFSSYVEALPEAEAQTVIATITTSVLTAGLGRGAVYLANRAQQKAEQADGTAQLLDGLNQLAAADKMLQRDPQKFEQFVASAAEDGPVSDVFIDAKTLAQSGIAEQLAQVSPAVAAQLPVALQTGGQIAIPVEEYAARIAPTEYAQALVDHLKTDPEGFSRVEAQEYLQQHAEELKAEVERTLAEKQGDDTFKASAETVKAEVKRQLDEAQRFTPQVNDAYAAMMSNFFAVQAAKLGITPEALFQRYPLKVGAEGVAGQQFDQGGTLVTDILHQEETEKTLLDLFNEADTINIEAPKMSEQEIADAERLFLSHFPKSVETYRRSSGIARRIRKASDLAADAISDDPAKPRVIDRPLGPFSAYRIEGVVLPGDEHYNPGGVLKIKIFGKEQVEAGLLDEAALTFTVMQDGELSVNGPTPGGATFKAFQARGWAEQAKAGDQIAEGWSNLVNPEGGKMPMSQVIGLLADVHARVRAWKMEDYTGLHWARATGALAALGDYGSAIFLQGTGNRGSFNPATNLITLLKNADLSTFLHESGHFFLEVQFDIAAQLMQEANAFGSETNTAGEAQLLADTSAILKWFGLRDLAEWNALDFDERRAYHEKFARGFEAYLFEGKAPSIELQGLFQRFRAWLLNVYRDLKALNVELNDEVRGVFDRMLASTDEIRLAEQARSMMPLFTSPEQAGMTPEEFAAYQANGVEATNEAIQDLQARGLRDMTWLHNARGRIIKKLQKEQAAARAEVQMEARREIMAEPLYRAWDYLTGRNKDTPESIVEVDGVRMMAHGKFALDGLEDIGLPVEIINHLKALKMTAKDGLHPDLVADMFGFSSGDELVRRLAATESPKEAIEALTDQRMLERHGEIATTEALERAADKAIHNDVRARMVATEANALAKATGQRKTLASAAKAMAQAVVGRLKVRSVRPGQYATAEVRAAKAAEKASKAGDVATAAAEKRNQLFNLYATRAAYDAQDEIEAGLRYLRRMDGEVKGLSADYVEQIQTLLSRFDLRQQSLKAIDRKATLAQWVESQREAGIEPDIPADLLDEAFKKSYKDMTVDEFRGLLDTVKQIEHLGRLKKKLLTAKDQREYAAIRDEIAASIEANAGEREADTRTPTTNLGRAAQSLKRFWASHIKAATWARVMDGGRDGGPVWEYFVRSANERGDRETTLRAEATASLSKILSPVFALGKMGGKGQFFPTIGRSLNREARLAIALNVGNEGNLQRLLGGEGWTLAQLMPVLQTVTTAEWQAVQAVWDHFESYRPEIAAKEKRVYGKEPQWVEPGSAVTAQFGLRGGYYPIKYDPAASQRAEEHADAEGAKRQMQGAYTSATTRRSFTKSRVEEVSGRPLLYTLAGVYSGVNDVIHDLSWHEWLIDANRLLRSQTIDRAIRGHYGPEVKAQLKAWVADIAEGDKASDAAVDQALSRLRQGISAAGLGFNVMSALIQPLGITQSIVRIGPTWAARGIARYVANPLQLTREVVGLSSFMENRSRTRFRELNELRNQVQDQTAFNEVVGRYAYWLMMRCQQMVDVPTWWGAYEKAMAEGNTEERAVSLADQAVIDAQGGGQTKDLAGIERGGPAQRLFTVYYSFMNTALNLGVGQTMAADTPAKKAKLAADYLLLYTVPAVLGYFLKAAFTPGDSGDDDLEKVARKLLANQIDYLMGLMVVVREFSEVAKTLAGANDLGRDYTGPAGLRLVADSVALSKQAIQGEFDTGFRKAVVNVVGDLFGLPAAQINRSVTGAEALAEGETSNPAALAFGFQKPR